MRFAATADDYFDLPEDENDAVYLEFNRNKIIARPNVNTEHHELLAAIVTGLLYKHLSDKSDY